MTIENTTGIDHLVESAKDSILILPEDVPDEYHNTDTYLSEISLEIDRLDLESGMIDLTCQLDGNTFTLSKYLPEFLGWSNPEHDHATISHETAGEIGDLVTEDLINQGTVDGGPGDVAVQSVTAVNQVEYVEREEFDHPRSTDQ